MNKIVNENDLKILLEKDKILSGIHEQYGVPPNWQRKPGFVTLCQIILEQQVSLESARAHFLKLNDFLGEFTPEKILTLSDDEMRNSFISRQKANYLRELSEAVVSGKLNLEEIHNSEEKEIREQLTSIKGIGNWTADIYLLFCLQHKNIFPIGDIAVIHSMKELYQISSKEEILEISESWQPFRSLATYFMWHYYLKKRGRIAIY
ncbi:DNA-3-methyladenine glycosylase family protein [Moheibacter sp.]|uniref:DNA-3-methyladenine glycosylase family protein n=1 Tax=Moheibacter sp. TaxID=1965316 RepID=UPI003C76799F